MKKIFIHIGLEKTGTSALQGFCTNNRELLKVNGIDYPDLGDSWIAHSKIPASILKNRGHQGTVDFYPHETQEIDAILKLMREKYKNDIYISSEHFSSRLTLNEIKYFHQSLKSVFPGREFIVICSVRDIVDFFYSSYSTLVKSGGTSTLDEYYNKAINKNRYFDFLRIIEEWSQVFGINNIDIIDFDFRDKEKNYISRLLPVEVDVPKETIANESLKSFTIRFGRAININSNYSLKHIDSIMPKEHYSLLPPDMEDSLQKKLSFKQAVITKFSLDISNFVLIKKKKPPYLSNDIFERELLKLVVEN